MSEFVVPPAILASLAAAAMASVGIALVARFHKIADRLLPTLTAFSGGLLVAAGLIHLFPEAIALDASAPAYFLGGFVAITVLHLLLHRHDGVAHPMAALVPAMGLSFHSLVDGLLYGAVFSVDVFTGLASVSGLILHELAEGMVLFVLVRAAGFSNRTAATAAIIGAAMTTPIGATVSVLALESIGPEATGKLLAMSGGALLGIGSSHLISDLPHKGRLRTTVIFVAGAVLASMIFTAFAHSHGTGQAPAHPPHFADHLHDGHDH